MNRPSRGIRLVAVLGMLLSMLAVLTPAAMASPNPSGGDVAFWDGTSIPDLFGAIESDAAGFDAFADGAQEVYFASVGNGEDFGLGAAQTSISIQNIDNDDAYIFFYVGDGAGDFTVDTDMVTYLSAGASKTFTAAELGIAEGTTVPVVVAGYNIVDSSVCLPEDDLNDDGDCDDEYVVDEVAVAAFVASFADPATITCTDFEDAGFFREDAQWAFDEYPGLAQLDPNDDGEACENLAAGPDESTSADVLVPVYMAGVAKQAVTGANLPYTTADDTSVSGYNAVSGREVGFFDQLYFPIVQTNCGPGGCWNSVLRIANVGLDNNAAVTVRFFAADDGSGSLNTGFQLQRLVDVGETWSIDLDSLVEEGWVGSAHVYTDDAVTAIVDRYKAGTDMWITNTASNAVSESDWQIPGGVDAPYVLFAPDVRTDWNGWNTGISVANTVDTDNTVNIQYFGSNGNAPQTLNRRLAAHGMTYFYNPSDPSEDDCEQPATDVPGCEYIGGAIILSEFPVTVAVDGVKYFGNDANVGQAFSYAATGNAFDDLALPLAQKGNPSTGMGATSGINFLNPNAGATVVTTTWINPSGFTASNFGDSIVWVPGFATGFVYTMFHDNLPNGFFGSAIVNSELPVAATSANVDYQVQGDGTTVWNLYNPCGFFRQAGDCEFAGPLEPSPVSATITKVVTCDTCDLDFDGVPDDDVFVEGALVSFEGTDEGGFAVSGSGLTGPDGEVVFAVPAGDYTVTIESVPDGYSLVGVVSDDVTVEDGDAVTLVNDITQAALEGEGVLTKGLDLGDELGAAVLSGEFSLNSVVWFCEGVITDTTLCDDLTDDAVVAHGGFDDFGGGWVFEFSADVPAGQYTICSAADVTGDYDADPLTPDETLGYDLRCEFTGEHSVEAIGAVPVFDNDGPFFVFDGLETFVMNDFEALLSGSLEVYVKDDVTDAAIAGATVTLFDDEGNFVAEATTDASGIVSFAVGAGTYTSTATAAGYETESATIEYSPIDDAFNGGVLDDFLTADLVQSLDPGGAVLGIATTINGVVAANAPVSVFAVGLADAFGEPGVCSGDLVGSGVTDAAGFVEFGVAAGDYCISTDLDNDGDLEATAVTVPAGDPAGDIDVTIDVVVDAALDVQTNNFFTAEAFVEVFVADAADTVGPAGVCAGVSVASGFTTNTVITFGLAAGDYCVEASPSDFFIAPTTGLVTLPAADPAGDVDLVLQTF